MKFKHGKYEEAGKEIALQSNPSFVRIRSSMRGKLSYSMSCGADKEEERLRILERR